MRNNLLNFAEFERETIAARVADAYQTKARETFRLSLCNQSLIRPVKARYAHGLDSAVLRREYNYRASIKKAVGKPTALSRANRIRIGDLLPPRQAR